MNCKQFIQELDEYLEGTLIDSARHAAAAHIHDCSPCQRQLARRQALRSALRDMPVPSPRPEFFDNTLNRAYRSHSARQRSYVIGTALAAGLALWIGFGWLPGTPHQTEKLASITIALNEARTVQLAFNAEKELAQAMLDIQLPKGVELQGYPGQREIRWQTDLARGTNMLSLPLIAVLPAGGVMVARLEHGTRSTEFAVQLRVNDRGQVNKLSTAEIFNVSIIFSSGVAVADDGALDVTIKIVESPADLPSAVTRTIKLPPAAAQKAREQPPSSGPGSGNAPGQSSANQNVGQNIVGENAPGKDKDKDKDKDKKKKKKNND